MLDASIPWPELSPPGYLGNLSLFVQVPVVSDGNAEAQPDTPASLKSALAQTIKAIRTSVKQTRDPATLRETMCTLFESLLSSAGALARRAATEGVVIDGPVTNWNQSGHEEMDFGDGPPDIFLGHFGILVQRLIGIMALSDGAFGVRIPLESKEALQRLKSSPILRTFAPTSGLLKQA